MQGQWPPQQLVSDLAQDSGKAYGIPPKTLTVQNKHFGVQ
jgi:hypothetical protein